ncbi:hypothetical protein NMG60_11013515 [Bertholletia excelsa]
METLRVSIIVVMAFLSALLLPSVRAHVHDLVAAPAPVPSSDGVAVDQGIAYLLMLVALVLTYLIH